MLRRLRFLAVLAVLGAGSVSAGVINGGFESGDLTGWSFLGSTMVLGAQGPIAPTGGSYMAEIASGGGATQVDIPALESFLGLPAGSLASAFPGLYVPAYGSAIAQTFSAGAGDTLTFNWNFATSEDVPSQYAGAFLAIGGAGTMVAGLADTTRTDILNQSAAGSGFSVMTAWGSATIVFEAAGTYTVGFGSLQTQGSDMSSALFVDSPESSVPEPSTLLLAVPAALLVIRRRRP